mgnify:CR=1 FL=1
MDMNQANILVCDDEVEVADLLKHVLEREGFAVTCCHSGDAALTLLNAQVFDLAILDIMMPGIDGFEVCRQIRGGAAGSNTDMPIVFLSAKTEEFDKVLGFTLGADDYVTKPFTPMELMARVNSQLRRYRRFLEKLVPQENVHVIGGLEINEDTVEVTMDGNPVKLTPIEYKILLLLAKNPGRVFSSEEIYERVWQEKAINTDTIMVHVRNIREKIEIDPKKPKYLKVVWGVGYKLEKQS